MTETTAAPARPGLRDPEPILFALAIFVSASLVFVVQPMVTKLVLPMLGGSPSVWNTAMVFFQAALLAGYAYAHGLQRIASLKTQVMVHLGLLIVAALFLPLRISGLLGEPAPTAPIAWLLAVLTLSVGAPFAVLSATAPLLQAWFARLRADKPDGANPYVLYAASNLGSFLALIAYPLLIEPLTTLSGQRWGWTGGYGLFVAMIAVLAFLALRRGRQVADVPVLAEAPPVSWRDRGIWIFLAAVPSSLMLGVTAHLSTDVASAPFLWVIPLALYLLTFVIAFQARPVIHPYIALMIQAALAAVCAGMLPFKSGNWAFMFALHLGTFFFTALICHQALAARRPAPARLTDFYLMLSLGGVVGGAFTALLAPVLFRTVLEYPLVLVLAAFARPWNRGPLKPLEIGLVVAAAVIAFIPWGLYAIRANDPYAFGGWNLEMASHLILGAAAICAFLIRDRGLMFALALAAISIGAQFAEGRREYLHTERSFFGVMRVANDPEPRLGGDVHILMHGTTLHGAQPVDIQYSCRPTLYYAPETPIGQVTQERQRTHPSVTVGVVGQGSGAMAGYVRETDHFTFFEIDPMVDRLSRNPDWFSFISTCARAPVDTVLGDARLTLEKEPSGKYDVLLIDAFTSDAVPTHLLTKEAIQTYLRLLKPDGAVILHLSNRNLEIVQPAVASAREAGGYSLHQIYWENQHSPRNSEASTEALVISPTEAGLAPFKADGRWREVGDGGVRAWTDDYVNLFGALWRDMKGDWEAWRRSH